ncbi:hypothetical protein [Thiobacillus sedimenti]|uniref:Uncharacterized protein n=1 Tax=Thiobacillus sedimenti TaxID=3110231 RepID=A0ABZ1CJS2_9PROT|nr:hypothetical protein [Thiobacillus sp. SCUT-2]WRS39116.1 hypothetical protein VA613_14060 [Thiobacillus sp. SCUT-2]
MNHSARTQRPEQAAAGRWTGGAADETDLGHARAAVGTLLENLGLAAQLYAVEPREGQWVVIVECATGTGWQRVDLHAGPELLAAIRGDRDARAALLAQWRAHLADCIYD